MLNPFQVHGPPGSSLVVKASPPPWHLTYHPSLPADPHLQQSRIFNFKTQIRLQATNQQWPTGWQWLLAANSMEVATGGLLDTKV